MVLIAGTTPLEEEHPPTSYPIQEYSGVSIHIAIKPYNTGTSFCVRCNRSTVLIKMCGNSSYASYSCRYTQYVVNAALQCSTLSHSSFLLSLQGFRMPVVFCGLMECICMTQGVIAAYLITASLPPA